MKSNRLVFTLVLLVGSGFTCAQESLTLFQATDNPEANENDRRPQRTTRQQSEPAFVLVGTTRFGDKYGASLRHRGGDEVQVSWEEGNVSDIKGYAGYGVAQIDSRVVSLRMPETDPCIENIDSGVTCNGRFAVLRLSNAEPIAGQGPQSKNSNVEGSSSRSATGTGGVTSGNQAEGQLVHPDTGQPIVGPPGEETIGNTGVLYRNPFSGEIQNARELTPEEVAAREEARKQRAENFRNFEIVRIPDDEIPEGMRRVRTPFGDSLEPIEE